MIKRKDLCMFHPYLKEAQLELNGLERAGPNPVPLYQEIQVVVSEATNRGLSVYKKKQNKTRQTTTTKNELEVTFLWHNCLCYFGTIRSPPGNALGTSHGILNAWLYFLSLSEQDRSHGDCFVKRESRWTLSAKFG